MKEITTTSPEDPAPAAPTPAAPTQAAPRPAAPGPGTTAPAEPAEPVHVDGYSCARAWAALTAAHARIADRLTIYLRRTAIGRGALGLVRLRAGLAVLWRARVGWLPIAGGAIGRRARRLGRIRLRGHLLGRI